MGRFLSFQRIQTSSCFSHLGEAFIRNTFSCAIYDGKKAQVTQREFKRKKKNNSFPSIINSIFDKLSFKVSDVSFRIPLTKAHVDQHSQS